MLKSATRLPWPFASWGCCRPGLVFLVAVGLQLCQEALHKSHVDECGAGFAPVGQIKL
jgi:hypothetical protein